MNKNLTAAFLLVLAAGCTSSLNPAWPPPMDASRRVSVQDCSRPVDTGGGNLMCRTYTEAERRALDEEERLARERKEAAERAERERLERERLERERARQLALEEAARKAREAEEARLAAERARLLALEEAARKAREERERQERLAAEAAARERAEREARAAAARECQRLEKVASAGRALLTNFVATYGKEEEFKEIAGQISAFLDRPRKPCPPAP